jgi:hypothetical protein
VSRHSSLAQVQSRLTSELNSKNSSSLVFLDDMVSKEGVP